MAFATGRQRYLLRQGYAYQVIKSPELGGFEAENRLRPFGFSTQHEQESLLATVLEHKLGVREVRCDVM